MLTSNDIKISVMACCLIVAAIPAASAETLIRVGGSGTGTGTMKVIAKAFEKKNPGITINVMPSLGSSGGIKALLGGGLDIAVSARDLKDDEKKQGATVVFTAQTPFVLMANKSVSRKNLTEKELVSILSGRTPAWADGHPIRLILRPEGDNDTKLIRSISPEISQALNGAMARPDRRIALTDQDADQDIENIRGALGFSTIAQQISERPSAKVLNFNGVAPSIKTLNNRTYPLAKDLLVLLRQGNTTPDIQKFISFLKSPEGLRLFNRNGIAVTVH